MNQTGFSVDYREAAFFRTVRRMDVLLPLACPGGLPINVGGQAFYKIGYYFLLVDFRYCGAPLFGRVNLFPGLETEFHHTGHSFGMLLKVSVYYHISRLILVCRYSRCFEFLP